MNDERKKRFEEAAAGGDQPLVVEYLRFLSRTKKFWLIPLVIVILLIGLIVVLGGSAAGPFIYPLF